MTVRQRIVRRWTRIKMRLAYRWDTATRCWCGGSLGPSRSPLVGECVECGTGVLRRRLTEASYERWYASDYRRWVMGTAEVSVQQLTKEIRRTEAALHWLHYVGYPLGNATVLDIGCGAGGALIACRIYGASHVYGVDVDARSDSVPASFGITVFRTIPPEARRERIWCSHLIEHVLDPVGLLRTLRDHLTHVDWSYIYVETPAWGPKAEVKLPHPYMYTEESFRVLAERAGLTIAALEPGLRAVLKRAG